MTGTTVTATVVKAHKVASGETLETIAAGAGMSWQALAQFNWGTSAPNEINRWLQEVVGCSKKTSDGRNYVFDDSDLPGIVFVPMAWQSPALPLDQRHTIRVVKRRDLVLRLVDSEDHPLPEVAYEVVLSDNSRRTGKLGRGGVALVQQPPEGPFAVYYPDHHDILAKSLAASLRDAMGSGDMRVIVHFLQHPPAIVAAATQAYAQYFNDYTGQGVSEDIYAAVTDAEALAGLEGLMAYAGMTVRGNIEISQYLESGRA